VLALTCRILAIAGPTWSSVSEDGSVGWLSTDRGLTSWSANAVLLQRALFRSPPSWLVASAFDVPREETGRSCFEMDRRRGNRKDQRLP
jgi:hypothetical protein